MSESPKKPVEPDWTCSICKRHFDGSIVPGIVEYKPDMVTKVFTCTPCVR